MQIYSKSQKIPLLHLSTNFYSGRTKFGTPSFYTENFLEILLHLLIVIYEY